MKRILISLFFFLSTLCITPSYAQFEPVVQPTVRIGIGHFYPPFIYNYSSGFDISLASALCAQMNVNCVFYSLSLTEMLEDLQKGKLDAIIGAVSITPQRQQDFLFTNPYLISTVSFLGLSNKQYPAKIDGLKVGVIAYSTFYTYLQAAVKFNKVHLITYTNYGDLLDALQNGNVDLTLLDTADAEYWISQTDKHLKLVGPSFLLPSDQGFGIAVNKANSKLANHFNQALDTLITNGTYGLIAGMYFDSSNQTNPAIIAPQWMVTAYPNAVTILPKKF